MSTYAQLQTRVSSNIIDSTTAVQTNVPVFVNAAIQMVQALHNFNCMKAEIQGVLTTNSTSTHFLMTTPLGFKEPRGRPYWWNGGSAAQNRIDWAPNKTYVPSQWQSTNSSATGAPSLLVLDNNVTVNNSGVVSASASEAAGGMPISYYPYSDGMGPGAGGQYPIYIPYWAILPDMASSSDTNWFATYMVEFVVCVATRMAFEMDWDEQRAMYWNNLAFGQKWDGVDIKTAGGWLKAGLELDKRIGYAPIGTGT